MLSLSDVIFEWIDDDPDLKMLRISRGKQWLTESSTGNIPGIPYIEGPLTMGAIYDDHVMVTSFGAIHADKGDALARFRLDAADPNFFGKLKVAMMEQGQCD